MFLLLSVFVLASVASPEVAPDPCEALLQCVGDNNMRVDGMWRWLFMPQLPTYNDWIDWINDTCNNWRNRSECNTQPFRQACMNFTIRRYSRFERTLTRDLCQPVGQQLRIYTEAPQCLGNSTFTQEATEIRRSCLAQRGLTIHSYMGDCRDVKAARDCYRNWVGERCGHLFRWLVDTEWEERFFIYQPNCGSICPFPWPDS